ncbi:MAG: hypothetical protein ABI595_11265 [Actinomycetota bacterium]
MPEDDDILEAYERELDNAPFEPLPRRSNRGFWMVTATMGLGAVVLMVEIFANRPMVNAISRTENDLTTSLRAAERIYSDGGSFTPADATALAASVEGRTYVDADRSASTPGTVSVYASGQTWAAASPTQQGTCFYLKQVAGQDALYQVADGDCTGEEALAADQTQW